MLQRKSSHRWMEVFYVQNSKHRPPGCLGNLGGWMPAMVPMGCHDGSRWDVTVAREWAYGWMHDVAHWRGCGLGG